jgi:hypothetical protein
MKTIHEKLKQLVAIGKLKEVRWFALNCAKSVFHLSTDPRRAAYALLVVESYLLGRATLDELKIVRAVAADAYDDAAAARAAAVHADDAVDAADAAACSDYAADAADAAACATAAAVHAYAGDADSAAVIKKQHSELDALIKDIEEVQK